MDWVERLNEECDKYKALLILPDIYCIGCLKESKICMPMVIKTKLNLKFLDDHKSLMVILCKDCGLKPPPTHKIVNNIIQKLLKESNN